MLLCIVLALILQNGSYSTSYRHWLDTTAGIVFGDFTLMKPLLLWINDGLITIFFFSIGLQLKIEFVEGHLSDPRNILLPSIAAIAGIFTPALIFILFNYHDEFAMRGWAIPTSTDTAFAVALIMLLGKRVPNSLKILLLSISVFDDMGAMAVVTIFYNSGLDIYALIPAAVSIVGLMILNFFGVGRKSLYIVLGAIIWFSILKSGVHATIAGIITAFSMPMRDRGGAPVVQEVSDNIGLWVSFLILPLFTLANAGVDLGNINLSTMFSNVSLGIILALIIGKPLGIFTVIYLASRYNLVQLPSDVNTKQIYGMSLLTGIGFSMAMFYDSLAYEGSSIYGYADSLAILIGATFSGIHGYCYLRFFACKTALIEYRPWLPAPTGYHGTARTANLYSLETQIQGPSSVAPTAAAVAEANKRNAAAAEAAQVAQKAIEAAEAASKVAELLKKASDKEQDEQNLAEVQLAAAQAAKAAATVAVTATKIDSSEDNAHKTQSAEAFLKTVSEVAQEVEETVENAIDEDKAVENQATLADEDKQDKYHKVANNETEELKSKSTTIVSAADDTKDSEYDKSEVKSQDTVKASQEAHTVIAVDSEGLAKVKKTVVKSTDESAAVVDDSPLNADDYASTTASAKSASDESKTQEDKIASNQSSKNSDDDVSEQSDESESSTSSKAESHVQESVESEAKTVKKIKAKTKYELSFEEEDHSSEKIAEHKEVAQGTAKAVAAYLSNIVGKAKVEVSENIERSDEEKAALRAAAAARVAAIKAAEIEAQALAEAAVAEAKAKAALQAAEAKAKAAAQESKSKADTTTESDSKAVADEQETLLQESTVDVAVLSKIASESKETVKGNAPSDELNAADFAPQANDSADTKAKAQEDDADKASLEASSKDESMEADQGEACASKSADSSDDEALKAAAEDAQEEVAKAAAEAEAAKAKALEAKQAVEKAAQEARVAAEIAAAKKAEGKQKTKAQNALEAQNKAEEGGHKEESDTLGEVTAKAASAVSTVASVVAAPAVKAVKIVSATASVTASVTAAAAKAAVKVVEHKVKAEDEHHDDKKDTTKEVADTLVKEIISAKDPRFSESNETSKDGSHDDSNATQTKADAKAAAKADAKAATATATADKDGATATTDSATSDSATVKPSTQDAANDAAIKEQAQAQTVDAKESKSFAEENSYSEKADDLTKAHDETVNSVIETNDAPEFAVANNNELNASDLSQKISTLAEQQAKVTLQAASDDDDLTVDSVLAMKSTSSDEAANSNAQAANGNMQTAEGNAASAASDDLNAEDYQNEKSSDVEDKDEKKEDSSAVKSVVGKLAGIIGKSKD